MLYRLGYALSNLKHVKFEVPIHKQIIFFECMYRFIVYVL